MGEAIGTLQALAPLIAIEVWIVYTYSRAPVTASVPYQVLTLALIWIYAAVNREGWALAASIVPVAIVGAFWTRDLRRAPGKPPEGPMRPLPANVEAHLPLLRATVAEGSPRRYEVANSLAFPRPPEQLFPWFGDSEHWNARPGRDYIWERLNDSPWGTGAEYRMERVRDGIPISSLHVVTSYDPPRQFSSANVGADGIVAELTITLRPDAPGGSVVTFRTTYHVTSDSSFQAVWGAVFRPILVPFHKHSLQRALRAAQLQIDEAISRSGD